MLEETSVRAPDKIHVHFEDETLEEKVMKSDDGPGWKYPGTEIMHPVMNQGVYWIQPSAFNEMSGCKAGNIPEVDNKEEKEPPEKKENAEEWKQGLFNCSDGERKTVFLTCICPDATMFKVLKSTSNNSAYYHSVFERNGFFSLLCFFLFLKWVFGFSMRTVFITMGVFLVFVLFAYVRRMKRICNLRSRMREYFGIKGSIPGDFAKTLFCSCCVLCQLSEEIKHQKSVHGDCEKFAIPIHHEKCPNSGFWPWKPNASLFCLYREEI